MSLNWTQTIVDVNTNKVSFYYERDSLVLSLNSYPMVAILVSLHYRK